MMARILTVTVVMVGFFLLGTNSAAAQTGCPTVAGVQKLKDDLKELESRPTPMDDPNTNDIIKAQKEWDAWGKKEREREIQILKFQIDDASPCWQIHAKKGNKNLKDAYLVNADLKKVDLRGVDLRGGNLSRADLTGADLREAELGRADLSDANLAGANLSNATVGSAIFANADLRGTDLTGCGFLGPKNTIAEATREKGQPLTVEEREEVEQMFKMETVYIRSVNLKGAKASKTTKGINAELWKSQGGVIVD